MSSINLVDISEDFSKAQNSRRKDYSIVKRGNRKVMAIHLGGIYIECLLKSVIIRKYGIIKRSSEKISDGRLKFCCWYNQKAIEKIENLKKNKIITEKDLWDNKVVANPEHNIVKAFKEIDELNNGAPKEVISALHYLNKPSNKFYIDYRYMSDDEISDADFEKWESNFLLFYNYFNIRKSAFTF